MGQKIQGSLSDDAYAEVEQQAYEAAIIPELWPSVLEKIGNITGTAGGLILSLTERGERLIHVPVFENLVNRFLNEGWGARNTRVGGVIAKGLVGAPRFLTEADYFEPSQELTDPIVNDLLRAEGFGWAAGFITQLPHGDMVVFNVEQYWEKGPIRGDALNRLNSLYSHLARAAMFAGRADFERVRTAIATLTAVGLPAAALTPSGKVVLTNDAFNVATHVWTTRGGDRLALQDGIADQMLRDALSQIDKAKSPRSIAIRTLIGGPVKAILQVVPIRRAAHDIFGSSCAVVVLSETHKPGIDDTLIKSLFDLTPSELAIAKALADGKTLADISASTGRSVATIRTHLKTVMSKTGCSRQVELVLLMLQMGGDLTGFF